MKWGGWRWRCLKRNGMTKDAEEKNDEEMKNNKAKEDKKNG